MGRAELTLDETADDVCENGIGDGVGESERGSGLAVSTLTGNVDNGGGSINTGCLC